MANIVFHKANSRGHLNHGWLDTYHSFSFGNYYNPEKVHFGALRVLNDDSIAPAMGFGTHPHDNMEIITIPMEGMLAHKDSMGNASVIHAGEVQVMSAGTGIRHSEYNNSEDITLKLLQIWVFPNQKNVTPRYDQIVLKPEERDNTFQQIVSPNPEDDGVWIHQDAWFYLGNFDHTQEILHPFHSTENGIYAFVIKGKATIEGQLLESKDAIGVWDSEFLRINVLEENTELLLMEVPMIF